MTVDLETKEKVGGRVGQEEKRGLRKYEFSPKSSEGPVPSRNAFSLSLHFPQNHYLSFEPDVPQPTTLLSFSLPLFRISIYSGTVSSIGVTRGTVGRSGRTGLYSTDGSREVDISPVWTGRRSPPTNLRRCRGLSVCRTTKRSEPSLQPLSLHVDGDRPPLGPLGRLVPNYQTDDPTLIESGIEVLWSCGQFPLGPILRGGDGGLEPYVPSTFTDFTKRPTAKSDVQTDR